MVLVPVETVSPLPTVTPLLLVLLSTALVPVALAVAVLAPTTVTPKPSLQEHRVVSVPLMVRPVSTVLVPVEMVFPLSTVTQPRSLRVLLVFALVKLAALPVLVPLIAAVIPLVPISLVLAPLPVTLLFQELVNSETESPTLFLLLLPSVRSPTSKTVTTHVLALTV